MPSPAPWTRSGTPLPLYFRAARTHGPGAPAHHVDPVAPLEVERGGASEVLDGKRVQGAEAHDAAHDRVGSHIPVEPPDGRRIGDDPHAREGPGTEARKQRPTPLVLLHGFTGSSDSWGDELLSGLAAGGRDVVLVDLPGHGGAPPPPPDRRIALDAAVRRVVDSVSGPFDLLGYSMGGRIALHVALRHPDRVRRLVLESASPGLSSASDRAARRGADEALAAHIEEQGVETFATEWADVDVLRPGPRRAPAASSRADRVRRTNRAPGLAAALRSLGTGSLPSLWDRLGDVRSPARLVTGALDVKFDRIARLMAEAMEGAVVDAVPDAGHTVHLDRPDAWLSLVTSWLDGSAR